ncbi:Flp pilus assembly protein CpaB [Gordonibacter sp. 28C]|uniref:Flp pilus assembly protein CpaB n=1 Tax=Gordonibacter sp. 28C TaxID=2078569 RepID=UPI000DF807CC|nr:Flp pilus assembly protein CpaB [Gordonibacter sp. 28C]RDB62019.1 Flp pilus assembly protein CpaB [Gordonibacter sp. 28C]
MIMQRTRERAGGPSGYASRENAGSSAGGDVGAAVERRARSRRPPGAPDVREGRDPQRVKGLAAVAAASVAVALVAAAYGTWAALSAQATVAAAGADAQPTLVAAADISAGDVLAASSFEVRSVPRSLRVRTALEGEALEGDASLLGQRALVDMPAGTQVTPAAVSGRADGARLSAALSSDRQAVTVAVDAESGLAGQLRPSDRVRVVALEGAASGEVLLATICDDVRVLSLDGDRVGGDGAYASVTLEVTPEQADAVRAAQWTGKVSLVLMPVLSEPTQGGPVPDAAAEAIGREEPVDG